MEEYQMRDIDLDKLSDFIRTEGELAEIPALHLLDTIRVMREKNLELTVKLAHSENAKLREEVGGYKVEREIFKREIESRISGRRAILLRAERLEKALEIYANKSNWCKASGSDYADTFEETGVIYYQDGWCVAQAALAAEKGD